LSPLQSSVINDGVYDGMDRETLTSKENGVYKYYLYFFKENKYYTD